ARTWRLVFRRDRPGHATAHRRDRGGTRRTGGPRAHPRRQFRRLARPADAGEAARGPPRPAAAALATARHRGRRALGREPHRDGRYWRGTTRFGGLRPNGEKAGAGRGRSGCTHFVAALWR